MYKHNTVITTLCMLLVFGMFVGFSDAQIDPEKIVGIWLLDENKGDVAEDASGNGYDGTITQSDWVDGEVDGALDIKKGGTVTIPFGKGVVTDKMSFILWIQFTDISEQQNYFSIHDQSGNRYVPYKEGPNVLRSWTNNWNVSSGVTVKTGTWYHVANTYDGNTAKIYVNGEEKVSQSVAKFQLVEEDQTAWLATDKGASFLSACIMDDVGLFNDALTKEEINNIMNHGIYQTAFAVEPMSKLPILWGNLKKP